MAAEHQALNISRRRFVQAAGVAELGLLAGGGRLPSPSLRPSAEPLLGS